jgi:hypothetical protein
MLLTYSNQELNADKVNRETVFQVDFTKNKGKFTGASDLLLNQHSLMNGMIK